MGIDKSAVEFDEVLVALMEQARTHMGNKDKVEGLRFAELTKFLKSRKIPGVVVKVLRKLIPDENNGFQLIGMNHLNQPVT